MEGLVLPDIQAIMLAVLGGAIMAVTMRRFLPGMKNDSFTPREWVPVATLLAVMVWVTYFLPQLIYFQVDTGREAFSQAAAILPLFTAYAISTIVILYLLQRWRNKEED